MKYLKETQHRKYNLVDKWQSAFVRGLVRQARPRLLAELILDVIRLIAAAIALPGRGIVARDSRRDHCHIRSVLAVGIQTAASVARACAFAVVVIIQTMLAGCNMREDTSAWSVKAPDAPNEMLSYWVGSVASTARQTPSTAELTNMLANDTNEIVDLHGCSLNEEVRAALSRLRRVRWLRLTPEAEPDDLRWIGEMHELRGISLDQADMTGANFQSLGRLRELQWLNLSYTRMAADDFKTLPRLESLEVLFLAGELVTDEYLSHLAELRLPSLAKLSLDGTNVTDAGIERICSMYELEYLNLYRSARVTEKSVESLARMQTLRVLGIGLSGICPDLRTNDAVEELARRLPRTRVDSGN